MSKPVALHICGSSQYGFGELNAPASHEWLVTILMSVVHEFMVSPCNQNPVEMISLVVSLW